VSSGDPEREGVPDAEHPRDPDDRGPLDIDRAFAAIVAGWADDSPSDGGWPAAEDLSAGRHRRADDPPATPAGSDNDLDDGDSLALASASASGPLLPPIGIPEIEEPADESEGFVPPEPPPLPRGDAVSRLAWAGVIGGPVFLLAAVIAWRTAPGILLLAAVAGFVGGFVVLVARMPKHRADDDDDGAVV
jgi:hypothetical protein